MTDSWGIKFLHKYSDYDKKEVLKSTDETTQTHVYVYVCVNGICQKNPGTSWRSYEGDYFYGLI